jgi:hypothetical protein
VRYEPAATNPTAHGCQTGTKALQRAIYAVWPELAERQNVYGCFNRRRIAGSSAYSLHAEGRAIDIGVPAQKNGDGWKLSCELIEHRVVYGVQRVIWDGHIWSVQQMRGWLPLKQSTANQHRDHIHIEQYWSAALKPVSVQIEYEKALGLARARG